MKKQIFLITLMLISKSIFSQTPDTALTYLSALNLNLYKNKPIDTFLLKVPSNYVSMKIISSDNPKYARILTVLYADKVTFYIYAHNFHYMNPRSETFTWDMALFRKEDVHHIEVWKAVDCYNGCPEGIIQVTVEQ
ncbi:MAG: hypothetical protein IPL84_16520 [Chitinophagaceae bacterium]|nr:hypothetical protein [Chitinophagaceae bacterium]